MTEEITKRIKNMNLTEELPLLTEIFPTNSGFTSKSVFIRDYRTKSHPNYSVLTIKIEWQDGLIQEWHYDSGPANETLEDIVQSITRSSGQKEIPVEGTPVSILTFPTVIEIINNFAEMRNLGATP